MKLRDVQTILNATLYCGEENLDVEIYSAFGSDLMSDVLAFVKDQPLLLTGLVNLQVIHTAEMVDMKCVVFVRGKKPTKEIVQAAQAQSITVMSSDKLMYEACGLLYANEMRDGCHGTD